LKREVPTQMDFRLIFDQKKSDSSRWDPICFSLPRRPSAVAVIIFGLETSIPKVLLIRRSTRLRSHRGQIGFPGGRVDDQDQSPEDTALREAFEEVGLPRRTVTVLGSIDPISSLDGSLVYPVIASTSATVEQLKINDAEVETVHLVPIISLTAGNRKKFSFNLFGCWRHSFLYDWDSLSIWGLSAEILAKVNFKWVQ
jgi:8-oxo-dGTP pyrophosphatase MutT (NUDIX family)